MKKLLLIALATASIAGGTGVVMADPVKVCDSGMSGPFSTETTQKGSCQSSHDPVTTCANPAGKTDTSSAHCR